MAAAAGAFASAPATHVASPAAAGARLPPSAPHPAPAAAAALPAPPSGHAGVAPIPFTTTSSWPGAPSPALAAVLATAAGAGSDDPNAHPPPHVLQVELWQGEWLHSVMTCLLGLHRHPRHAQQQPATAAAAAADGGRGPTSTRAAFTAAAVAVRQQGARAGAAPPARHHATTDLRLARAVQQLAQLPQPPSPGGALQPPPPPPLYPSSAPSWPSPSLPSSSHSPDAAAGRAAAAAPGSGGAAPPRSHDRAATTASLGGKAPPLEPPWLRAAPQRSSPRGAAGASLPPASVTQPPPASSAQQQQQLQRQPTGGASGLQFSPTPPHHHHPLPHTRSHTTPFPSSSLASPAPSSAYGMSRAATTNMAELAAARSSGTGATPPLLFPVPSSSTLQTAHLGLSRPSTHRQGSAPIPSPPLANTSSEGYGPMFFLSPDVDDQPVPAGPQTLDEGADVMHVWERRLLGGPSRSDLGPQAEEPPPPPQQQQQQQWRAGSPAPHHTFRLALASALGVAAAPAAAPDAAAVFAAPPDSSAASSAAAHDLPLSLAALVAAQASRGSVVDELPSLPGFSRGAAAPEGSLHSAATAPAAHAAPTTGTSTAPMPLTVSVHTHTASTTGLEPEALSTSGGQLLARSGSHATRSPAAAAVATPLLALPGVSAGELGGALGRDAVAVRAAGEPLVFSALHPFGPPAAATASAAEASAGASWLEGGGELQPPGSEQHHHTQTTATVATLAPGGGRTSSGSKSHGSGGAGHGEGFASSTMHGVHDLMVMGGGVGPVVSGGSERELRRQRCLTGASQVRAAFARCATRPQVFFSPLRCCSAARPALRFAWRGGGAERRRCRVLRAPGAWRLVRLALPLHARVFSLAAPSLRASWVWNVSL